MVLWSSISVAQTLCPVEPLGNTRPNEFDLFPTNNCVESVVSYFPPPDKETLNYDDFDTYGAYHDGRPLILVFEDNFDSLNTDAWDLRYHWGPVHGQEERPENVTVSEGTVKLTTRKENWLCTTEECAKRGLAKWIACQNYNNSETSDWFGDMNCNEIPNYGVPYEASSASMKTTQFYHHGMFEIRAKLGHNRHCQTFWLYDEVDNNANGDAKHEEIDVFEAFGHKDEYHQLQTNVHKEVSCNGEVEKFNCPESHAPDNNYCLSDEWHTYTLIWNDLGIFWLVDGELMREVAHYQYFPLFGKREQTKLYPEYPMRVYLSNSILEENFSQAPGSSDFEIDYVRIWQYGNCDDYLYVDNWPDPPFDGWDANFNMISGQRVFLQGTDELPADRQVSIYYSEFLHMGPGMTIGSGATVTTQQVPDMCDGVAQKTSNNPTLSIFEHSETPDPIKSTADYGIFEVVHQDELDQLWVYNMVGQVVGQFGKNETVSLSNEPAGQYVFKVNYSTGRPSAVKKVALVR